MFHRQRAEELERDEPMTNLDDPRLRVARHALRHELACIESTTRISWYESTRASDATVLAFEVTHPAVRRQQEDLIGAAINDGRTLLVSTRNGDTWTIGRLDAGNYEI